MKSLRNKITGLWNRIPAAFFGLLTLTGLIGSILFLPMNLDDDSACIFEMASRNDQPVPVSFARAVPGIMPITAISHISPKKFVKQQNHIRLYNYMNRYLLWWWGSIGLLILGVTSLYNRRMLARQYRYHLSRS